MAPYKDLQRLTKTYKDLQRLTKTYKALQRLTKSFQRQLVSLLSVALVLGSGHAVSWK